MVQTVSQIGIGGKWGKWMTIVAGVVSAVVWTTVVVADHAGSGAGLIDRALMFELAFIWAIIWFIANAIRFLEGKRLAVLSLLPAGVGLVLFGIAQGFFVQTPEGDWYRMALGIAPIALGLAALLSVLPHPMPIQIWPLHTGNSEMITRIIIDPIGLTRRDPPAMASHRRRCCIRIGDASFAYCGSFGSSDNVRS